MATKADDGYFWVQLTPAEIALSATAGVFRECHVINGNLKDEDLGPSNNCWQRHIDGAMAECALAKHLNFYWQGKGSPGDEDFAGGIEVRSAAEHFKRLILQPKDADGAKFYFLTGQYGLYKIHGWIMGIDGKQPEYWEKPKGAWKTAYFVPENKLTPMEE